MSEQRRQEQAAAGTREEPHYDEYLDARGLDCPLPVLKAKLALNRMPPGSLLRVDTTDLHARIDFEAYCARSGHELLCISEANPETRIFIKRAAA